MFTRSRTPKHPRNIIEDTFNILETSGAISVAKQMWRTIQFVAKQKVVQMIVEVESQSSMKNKLE